MYTTKQEQLLRILRDATEATPGTRLSTALGVSTRSVRNYVRELNELAGTEMISASHRGYVLDERALRSFEQGRRERTRADTPMQRLYYIVRRLVTSQDGVDVYDLAAMLYVSDATIEADLAKVRTLVREFALVLRRHQWVVALEGSERDKRRLVRQILLDSTHGVAAVGLSAALREYHSYDLPSLIALLRQTLTGHGLTVQEYALTDLALHVVIAVDRVSAGHLREQQTGDQEQYPALEAVADDLADTLEARYGVSLPAPERRDLARLIAARTGPNLDAAGLVADDPSVVLVRQVMRELSESYLLDVDDPTFPVNLALHVHNLVRRARTGAYARNPLGASFKQSHPLVHELAVFVASRIEAGTGVEVNEDEIAFLSLHLGAHLHKSLAAVDQVSVACAAPQYYDAHRAFVDRLAEHLGDTAVIQVAVDTVHHDWSTTSADVVVSSVEVGADVPAEVVMISPVPTRAELDRVSDVVRAVRARKVASRIRWTLSELLDPRLFWHVDRVTQGEALSLMCRRLHEEGVTAANILDDVLERERLSPTAFGGALAVPHSMRMDATRTAISVLVSDEPIEWAGSQVHLVVLFALSADGRHVFRDVLDEMIAALAEPAKIATLIGGSASYEDFVTTLLETVGR
ncbi:BglG family transcription antiterminator [Cellulomonas soli]|uniref:BglG family transcription antiterminator n=1 Tax=Cellulomonas soli TaxID=931535 RepID=UPI003F85B2D5